MQTLTPNVLRESIQLIHNCQELVRVISLKSDNERICKLSVKVLANLLDAEQSDIIRWKKKLLDFGLIEQEGMYVRVVISDVSESPLGITNDLLMLIAEEPQLSFRQQAESLGLEQKQLEVVYGYLISVIM
ncbi:hypothetical protein [Paenibacillus eucommiae]|uniref:Uncharacterized protein n=1 Tax=Paenibacillus eucommiae TaxID=1355755 RepID=A0ABS4IRY3_9BACL|nr:hypothetical protein [Paenibacillus eucommiae]MBP1990339.1 hypothetical protein [Paenibacillus eucommiae]